MTRETVENALWGFKGELKEKLEGGVVPQWLETPQTTTHSQELMMNALREADEEDKTVNMHFEVDTDDEYIPDNIAEKLAAFASENNVDVDRWILTLVVNPGRRVDQGEMEVKAEF